MAEELSEVRKGWKIWKNPSSAQDGSVYLGEFYPPERRFFFIERDLRELGLGPGDYTVLAPEGFPHSDMFSRWQKVSIPGC